MTAVRISIPALRYAATHPINAHDALYCAEQTLALVEAVEAARYACDRWPGKYANAEPQRKLARALARFDFGGET